MVLSMTRPWKHPVTGVYYFRKGVPEALRKQVGKREEKISLGTRDPDEAKTLHLQIAAQIDEKWHRLREQPSLNPEPQVRLTQRQINALAGEMYHELLEQHRSDPGHRRQWQERLLGLQYALAPWHHEPEGFSLEKAVRSPYFISDVRMLRPQVAEFLHRKGLQIGSYEVLLCKAAAIALSFGYKTLIRWADGDNSPDPYAARFPAFEEPLATRPAPWSELYARYVLEAKPKPATQKRQRGVFTALFAFLGHDDANRITQADMIRWKEHCLTLKQPVTVRDADIAHPKTLFKWAHRDGKIRINPAEKVSVRVPKRQKLREAEFTNEEVERILSWTLVPIEGRTSVDRAAAIRWVPWLCHYSGARVNEITQMRAIDVFPVPVAGGKEVWMMRITPEAGTVKDDEARQLAVHPYLIEQGFLDYVRNRKGKCLFYDPSRGRGGSEENPIYKKVGEYLSNWVRVTVGVSDRNVDPNHGWRHLFRSMCLAAKIEPEVIDAMDGHAPVTVGHAYGSVWPEVSYERISRLPKTIVKPAREGVQIPGAKNGVGKRPRLKRAQMQLVA